MTTAANLFLVKAMALKPPVSGRVITEGASIPSDLKKLFTEIGDVFQSLSNKETRFQKTKSGFITNYISNAEGIVNSFLKSKTNSQVEIIKNAEVKNAKDFKKFIGKLIKNEDKYRFNLESYIEHSDDTFRGQIGFVKKGGFNPQGETLVGNFGLYLENAEVLEKNNPKLCKFVIDNLTQKGISSYNVTHNGVKYTITPLIERGGLYNLWGKRHLVGLDIKPVQALSAKA